MARRQLLVLLISLARYSWRSGGSWGQLAGQHIKLGTWRRGRRSLTSDTLRGESIHVSQVLLGLSLSLRNNKCVF